MQRLPAELLVQVLNDIDWNSSFVYYDDDNGQSLLSLWNLRQVSRQFCDAVDEIFMNKCRTDLMLRFYVRRGERFSRGHEVVHVTFQFSHFDENRSRLVFRLDEIRRYYRAWLSHHQVTVDKFRQEYDLMEHVHKFHFGSDVLVDSSEIPGWRIQSNLQMCSFDWRSVFSKHFCNRKIIQRWKFEWEHVLTERLDTVDVEGDCGDIKITTMREQDLIDHANDTKGGSILRPGMLIPLPAVLEEAQVWGHTYRCQEHPEDLRLGGFTCQRKRWVSNFENNARMHVMRLVARERFQDDRIIIDALRWMDSPVERHPIVTHGLSTNDVRRCMKLATSLWIQFWDSLRGLNQPYNLETYLDDLVRILQGFYQPFSDRYRPYWKSVGFASEGELNSRDFVWPTFAHYGPRPKMGWKYSLYSAPGMNHGSRELGVRPDRASSDYNARRMVLSTSPTLEGHSSLPITRVFFVGGESVAEDVDS